MVLISTLLKIPWNTVSLPAAPPQPFSAFAGRIVSPIPGFEQYKKFQNAPFCRTFEHNCAVCGPLCASHRSQTKWHFFVSVAPTPATPGFPVICATLVLVQISDRGVDGRRWSRSHVFIPPSDRDSVKSPKAIFINYNRFLYSTVWFVNMRPVSNCVKARTVTEVGSPIPPPKWAI